MPLPLPVSLRNTTALGSLLENTYTVSGYNELRGEENTLVSLYKNQETPYSINRILFIRRGKNNTLQSLNKGDLYKSMLFNLKNALNIGREQITIGGLINSICGYELSYGDLNMRLNAWNLFEFTIKLKDKRWSGLMDMADGLYEIERKILYKELKPLFDV